MTYKPLLASTDNIDGARLDTLVFPYLASPKIDGIRMLCDENLGPVTRTLKPIPNKHIRELYKSPLLQRFDGEIHATYNGTLITDQEAFNGTQSAVMSFDGKPDSTYYVFDLFHKTSDVKKRQSMPYKERYRYLIDMISLANSLKLNVELVEQEYISNLEDLLAYEEKKVALGYEGIMLRDPNGAYKHGRSTLKQNILLKMKRFVDAEAIITGWEPLMVNENEQTTNALGFSERSSHKENKYADDTRVGKIHAQGINGAFKRVNFSVGSGFDDDMRRWIRQNINKLVQDQAVFTYKYQNHGIKDKPRLPIFKGLRPEHVRQAEIIVNSDQESLF